MHEAQVPGALNLQVSQLALDDILYLATSGAVSAQTTLEQLAAFFGSTPISGITVEDSGQTLSWNIGLLVIDTTAGGNTTINLDAAPLNGQRLQIKDGGGQLDIGVQSITVQSAAGDINGQSTLVMEARWQFVDIVWSEVLGRWLTI